MCIYFEDEKNVKWKMLFKESIVISDQRDDVERFTVHHLACFLSFLYDDVLKSYV